MVHSVSSGPVRALVAISAAWSSAAGDSVPVSVVPVSAVPTVDVADVAAAGAETFEQQCSCFSPMVPAMATS